MASVDLPKVHDVVIVGAGVCGCALAYLLRRYTNVGSIALIEKCSDVAQVNSHSWNNSQTLHFGDIETNYGLERSKQVKEAADMVKRYLQAHDRQGDFHRVTSKMVLAVGDEQVRRLEERYAEYRSVYPDLRLLRREEIAQVEPKVVEGRDPSQTLAALWTSDGYIVDFGGLSRSFFEQAQEERQFEARFDTKVEGLQRSGEGFALKTNRGTVRAKTVAVMGGSNSLLLARDLECRGDSALLSVAGSFFHAPAQLSGKVYTMQIDELPFAAVHGDPEVHDPSLMRFGPTAKVLPVLERRRPSTFWDYLKTAGLRLAAFLAFFKIVAKPVVFRYVVTNLFYDLPWLGARLFAKKARHIVPSLRTGQLKRARGYGGVRPQLVDVRAKSLNKGEQKIRESGIVFNITPSPGASVCLQSARDDVEHLLGALGDQVSFDRKRLHADLASIEAAAEQGETAAS